ncbi:Cyclin-dependent kinase 15 [Liparis tanakae]|uniref:Cyclin-dependent kinase 15 n=1 Tax=Liparis tanakae TaxID=230148 RepID=A0A4Z2GS01_9TELE|nr:Cyclin-dependent kinase 15 [Liparis tanakae]
MEDCCRWARRCCCGEEEHDEEAKEELDLDRSGPPPSGSQLDLDRSGPPPSGSQPHWFHTLQVRRFRGHRGRSNSDPLGGKGCQDPLPWVRPLPPHKLLG